ncbi:hypothetical protein RvY_09070 [Ramazzottius varieornatus]|uniref:Prefoldin subunit 3 n=1 Tax=Ramazzottius varieornatus TaxID=947166 RepID=A0A1D1V816_RAMVA|nr:hypothetical protein RvY_09070 [Ramazzottius varieornatus]
MNVGLALLPSIQGEVDEIAKVCSASGIRKATPLNREDMVEKVVTADALNSVASAQQIVVTAWKDVEGNVQLKRSRIRSLIDHWTKMLRTINELRTQESATVRYVIGHQMQAKATLVPEGRVIMDIGANLFVDFSFDEAEQRLLSAIELGEKCSEILLSCYEECKKNIVTSEINISQLHNYSVEIRDTLIKATKT